VKPSLAVGAGPSRAILGGELANGLVDDLPRRLLAKFVLQRLNEWDEHSPFDLAALEMADWNFGRVDHGRSPAEWFVSVLHAAKTTTDQTSISDRLT
jgi:hypothetical protein